MEKYIFLDFDGVMTSGKNYDVLVSAGKPVCDEHPYVILDDLDAFTKEQQSHFVKVNPTVGLSIEDAVKAIEILNI